MQHYRLSILDEKNGTQPMEDNHGNLSIVFNGLIYNYKSLKKKLQDKFNSKFLNNSDTEVILEAYKVWGINILQKLDGMFSFVIYDKKQKKLFVARDRFGEKPIYYSISDNNFFFSSDAKSIQNFIKSNTSKLALAQYLFYGYIPSPKTVYDKIEKLRPGNYLIYNLIDNSPPSDRIF